VWKNIRERLQKYDRKLTKTPRPENFFILVWLEFQPILTILFQNLSWNLNDID